MSGTKQRKRSVRKRQPKKLTKGFIKQHLYLFKDISDLAVEGLLTDGGHHKQWYIEQMLKALGFDVDELEKKYAFERGIAP